MGRNVNEKGERLNTREIRGREQRVRREMDKWKQRRENGNEEETEKRRNRGK